MKPIFTALLVLLAAGAMGQIIKTEPCQIDTVKGILYFVSSGSTNDVEEDTGYFIAACGGFQILPEMMWTHIKCPKWIPGTVIRNDLMDARGHWNPLKTYTQYNWGRFTDGHFRPVAIDRVYGLWPLPKPDTIPWTPSRGWFQDDAGHWYRIKDMEDAHKNAGRIPAKKEEQR